MNPKDRLTFPEGSGQQPGVSASGEPTREVPAAYSVGGTTKTIASGVVKDLVFETQPLANAFNARAAILRAVEELEQMGGLLPLHERKLGDIRRALAAGRAASGAQALPNDVESLAAKFHEVYQEEAKRQGDVRHKDSYADLPENIKEFDRVLARYVLAAPAGHAELSEEQIRTIANDSEGIRGSDFWWKNFYKRLSDALLRSVVVKESK